MKKVTSKKLIGGLLIIMLLAIIGAVLVTAESSNTTLDDENKVKDNYDETADNNKSSTFCSRRYIRRQRPFFLDLTEEQQEEIEKIVTSLKEEGASREEIGEAIFAKLDEFGLLDRQLDNEIECTEKRLEILYRQKELREEGYSWDELRDIIQEEFDLELPYNDDQVMKLGNDFRCGPNRGYRGFNHGEEFDH